MHIMEQKPALMLTHQILIGSCHFCLSLRLRHVLLLWTRQLSKWQLRCLNESSLKSTKVSPLGHENDYFNVMKIAEASLVKMHCIQSASKWKKKWRCGKHLQTLRHLGSRHFPCLGCLGLAAGFCKDCCRMLMSEQDWGAGSSL